MRVVLAAILIILIAAPAADAAGWSRTRTFAAGLAYGLDEPAPRAAIDARGRSLLVWERADGRLMASIGDRRGRFGAPVRIARRPLDYAVAPGAIAYEAANGIHVAVRDGRRFRDRRVATSTGKEINGVAIAADPLGGWVVAERQFPRKGSGVPYHVRVLSLDERGRPLGKPQDLGLGEFGIDARPTQALAVRSDGLAVLAFRREAPRGTFEPQPVVVATRRHGAAFGEPTALAAGTTDPRVTVSGSDALVTATAIALCGDTSCAGQPRASRVAADGALGPLVGPTLARPSRAFAPWAAPTGAATGAIVFQLKERVEPFSREAPVRAVALRADGSVGPVQMLTGKRASEPVGLPISGGRVLAVWATRSALGAALAGQDGRFKRITAPTGRPPAPNHTNSTNRDARSAGRYAIVTWARGGIVRVSVRRF